MEDYVLITGYSDYEIALDYPHQIRRTDNKRIVKESVDTTSGYVRLNLVNDDGKRNKVYKHRIVALTFVPNDDPARNTEVDHINHNRTDNHISNLRWVSKSTNNKNRTGIRGVTYEFVHQLPANSVKINEYNDHLFDDVYYNADANTFYKKVADDYFRVMHQSSYRNKSYVTTVALGTNQVKLYNHIINNIIDTYPAVDEFGNLVDEEDEEQI